MNTTFANSSVTTRSDRPGLLATTLETISLRRQAFFVLIVAFAVRAPILFALDTVTAGWHSADYGSIARNFFRNGFHLFYPQIDWGGDGPGYVEMEFPIVPYITALFYAVVGRPDDRLGVIVPLVSGMLAVWWTYQLARELFRPAEALVAGLFAAVSPVFARFSQLAFPEAPMLAASAASMYFAVRWFRSGQRRHLLISAAATTLALLLKPTALILGVPLAWIFWLRYGTGLFMRWEPYAFGLIALGPAVAWYAHALSLAEQYGNSFGILFGGGSSKMANREILTNPEFYWRLASRIAIYHMTVGGAIAAVWCLRVRFSRLQRLAPIWLLTALASLLVVAQGNWDGAYYQLPIVLPACLCIGVGVVALDADLSRWLSDGRQRFMTVALVAVIGTGVVVGSALNYLRSDYVLFTMPRERDAQELRRVLEPGALIAYSEHQLTLEPLPRGQHVTPPHPFYFSDHKGWYLATEWTAIDEIEKVRARGARYFVLADIGILYRIRPEVVQYLEETYPRVQGRMGLTVWDLNPHARPRSVTAQAGAVESHGGE